MYIEHKEKKPSLMVMEMNVSNFPAKRIREKEREKREMMDERRRAVGEKEKKERESPCVEWPLPRSCESDSEHGNQHLSSVFHSSFVKAGMVENEK